MGRDLTYMPLGSIVLTVPITAELHRQLKMAVASEETTIKAAMTQMIEAYVLLHTMKEL